MHVPLRQHGRIVATRLLVSAGLSLLLLFATGCGGDASPELREVAYASEADGPLRDQLGPKSKILATIPTGRRLLILERMNRWARVRVEEGNGAQPLEGWMHQRQMVSEEVFKQFQQLAEQSEKLPSQGAGLVRRLANLRLNPGRTTQSFYQLSPDTPMEVLKHTVATREATAEEVRRGITEPIPEDWLLVRAAEGRSGWVLESLAELTPPLEVARYRESQRIRAWFELYKEQAADGAHSWYLWATVPKLSGAAHDFEELRVFVWNPAASRYETAYRERGLQGFLPVTVSKDGGEQGDAPAFSFEHLTAQGERVRRSYYMVGRQVRLQRAAQ